MKIPNRSLVVLMSIFIMSSCTMKGAYEPDPMGPPTKRELGSFSKAIRWYVDTTHSSLLFRTGHTAVHDVIGWVQSYRIDLTAQRFDFSDMKVNGVFRMNTITMPNQDMAANVMSDNFINADSFPIAEYHSRKVKYQGISQLLIDGDLTLKGVTRPVPLEVKFNGYANLGHTLPGFTVFGKFSRFAFGISQRDTLRPSNVPMVDDTIYITGNFRLYHE